MGVVTSLQSCGLFGASPQVSDNDQLKHGLIDCWVQLSENTFAIFIQTSKEYLISLTSKFYIFFYTVWKLDK